MPVIGHAIIGLSLSAAVAPPPGANRPARPGLWALLLVTLAYLPDVAAQAGIAAGAHSFAIVSHSMVFALALSAALTFPLARALRTKPPATFVLILVSLVLHDGMDILQSPGRMPFWPVRMRADVGSWIPSTLAGEAIVCLPFLVGAIASRWRHLRLRTNLRRDWAALAAVTIIVIAAAATSELRDHREDDLVRARELAETGRYHAALEACERADRWPSTAQPGRIDYIRAMAWWGLGDTERAEQRYLRSYEADPGYIWTVADLAVLSAQSDAPLEERRERSDRWLAVLQSTFPEHPALPRLVARVERGLSAPPR